MANRYNKENNVVTFKIGDRISLHIPWIDRTCSDLPRFPCAVVGVKERLNQYKLRCTRGLLSTCYPSNELEYYKGKLLFGVDGFDEQPTISLRSAARNAAS